MLEVALSLLSKYTTVAQNTQVCVMIVDAFFRKFFLYIPGDFLVVNERMRPSKIILL